MSNDTLSQLRGELGAAAENLKQCNRAYKGFRAFKNSPQGLAFCAEQLRQATTGLREYAGRLATIAEDLHISLSDVTRPEETLDIGISMDGQRWACSHFSGQASSRARGEVAIRFNMFHRPAL